MIVLKQLWTSIKRNPVINAFFAAVMLQFFQDYRADAIDWAHFLGYIATLCLGVIARGFTVPAKEVERDAP